jgi:hypothetical protein
MQVIHRGRKIQESAAIASYVRIIAACVLHSPMWMCVPHYTLSQDCRSIACVHRTVLRCMCVIAHIACVHAQPILHCKYAQPTCTYCTGTADVRQQPCAQYVHSPIELRVTHRRYVPPGCGIRHVLQCVIGPIDVLQYYVPGGGVSLLCRGACTVPCMCVCTG